MHHVPKIKPPNKKIQYFLLNFKKATILHNFFYISLFKDISGMYFKKNLIYNKEI